METMYHTVRDELYVDSEIGHLELGDLGLLDNLAYYTDVDRFVTWSVERFLGLRYDYALELLLRAILKMRPNNEAPPNIFITAVGNLKVSLSMRYLSALAVLQD